MPRIRNLMRLLLTIHIVVPSVNRFAFYANNIVLSWSGFDWYPGTGWVVFAQYAFVGVPAFMFIGLTTFLPFLLLALLLLRPKSAGRERSIVCLALSLVLLAVYLDGWLLYTWPIAYQPTQTSSIMLFTVLAYWNWRQTQLTCKRTTDAQKHEPSGQISATWFFLQSSGVRSDLRSNFAMK